MSETNVTVDEILSAAKDERTIRILTELVEKLHGEGGGGGTAGNDAIILTLSEIDEEPYYQVTCNKTYDECIQLLDASMAQAYFVQKMPDVSAGEIYSMIPLLVQRKEVHESGGALVTGWELQFSTPLGMDISDGIDPETGETAAAFGYRTYTYNENGISGEIIVFSTDGYNGD